MSNLKQNVKVLNSFSLYTRGKSRYLVVLWLRRNAIIYIQQGKRENLEKKKINLWQGLHVVNITGLQM